MRILKTALALSVAIAFTGSALACDGKDKSAQVNHTKQQTASTTSTVNTDQAKTKANGN